MNGIVVTSWFVNDDAANQAFRVSAIEIATGDKASATFTDTVPANVSDALVDLTTEGNTGNDGAVVYQQAEAGSGTGVFPAFVTLQNNPTEQGYNSDNDDQQFDEGNNGPHNHSIQISDIPIVMGDGNNGTDDGTLYYQFLLDAHESQGNDAEYISLDQLIIYQEEDGDLTGFDPDTGFFDAVGEPEHLVYDLDASGDNWIAIDAQLSSGGGKSDMALLIPVSLFSSNPDLTYVYLYSQFGSQVGWASGSTPEEWALGDVGELPVISGQKLLDADGDLSTTDDQTPLEGWTIYIDADGSNTLNLGDLSTTTDADGNYSFGSLLPGTYTIREVVEDGYTQLSPLNPDEHVIELDEDDSTGNDFINLLNNPSYTIDKTITDVDGEGPSGTVDEAGDVISYQIVVTNDGNVDLTGVDVSDPLIDATLTGPTESDTTDGILAPGETWTYTGTYTVQQGDINDDGGDDGDIDNTATVSSNELPDESDSEETPIDRNPSYTIDKTITDVDGDGPTGTADEAGDVISYQIVVTNDGNVDLTSVDVSDPLIDATLTGPTESDTTDGILAPGETWTYTGTYTVQQGDINDDGGGDGDIDNTATVSSDELDDESDSEEAPIDRNPSYTIDKTITDVDGEGPLGTVEAAGDVISYQIVVTNDGNVDLEGVDVSDPLLEGANGTLGSATESIDADGILQVGETWTYTGTYTVQQGDINDNGGGDGDIDNTATVSSDELDDESDSASAPVDTGGGGQDTRILHIEKDADLTSVDSTSDVITYTMLVTNIGTVAIANVTVDDPFLSDEAPVLSGGFNVGDTNTDGLLDIDETWQFTGTHQVTQDELDSGDNIVNTATATGDDASPDDDSAIVPVDQNKALHIEKDADVACVDSTSDVITYTMLVTNAGNAAIANVDVDDPFLSNEAPVLSGGFNAGDTDGDNLLDVGETWQYTGSHQVTQAELNSGNDIVNTATATGDDAAPDSDNAIVDVVGGNPTTKGVWIARQTSLIGFG